MSLETPNLNYIVELSGGDKTFEDKFITILKDEFPREKEEYLRVLHEGLYRETALIVHKLKHKLNILGLEKGYGTAVAFEEELLSGGSALSGEFENILDTIEAYLKTI